MLHNAYDLRCLFTRRMMLERLSIERRFRKIYRSGERLADHVAAAAAVLR